MSKKVPQIRFNGFTDPWEERKLGDFIKISREQEVKKVDLHEEKIGYYVLAMRTFDFEGYIDYSKPYWINNFESADDDLFLNRKEFAIIDADMDASLPKIGKVLLNATNNKFLLAAHIRKIKVDVQVDSIFAYALMRTTELVERLKLEANGSISKRLLDKNVYKQKVYLPIHLEEQQQIGEFFWTLEETIALHQRKLDLLKEQKKGYLQKMFPKNGAKVPELRFAGFADDWEERKLGEISKTTIGEFVIKTKQSDESPYPVYNGGRSYTGKYDEYNNDGPKIVISARGANAGFVNYVSGRYWAGNSCYSVSVTKEDEFSIGYLYQFIKYNQVLFTAYQQAANIPSVSKSDVEKFSIKYPTVLEQKKIESFFKQLDNTIALHQRKLELLKEQKKGFLQKMFV